MEEIKVKASRDYRVSIGAGLFSQLCTRIPCRTGTAVIVSDEAVAALYLKTVSTVLEAGGYRVQSFLVPQGEEAKSLLWYEKLLSFLADAHVTRSDTIFALGGGVVGDLSGFAASSYLRGIAYVQLPTTLLAAVDSSVGGKTAINLPEGKNLVGAFYQPHAVIMDTDTLFTLSAEIFADGCAEIIKYGVLADEALFSLLAQRVLTENRQDTALLETVIARCVAIKRDIVAMDERDTGVRNLLNLGHTFGHAIEKCSGFSIRHGHAVAAGMAMVGRVAARHGICDAQVPEKIEALLRAYGLPVESNFSPNELLAALRSDKKISAGALRLILPERIGACRMEEIPLDALDAYLLG